MKRKRNNLFGPEAKAAAKRVVRSRSVADKSTGERGHIIGAGPQGWLKVKWTNRDKPTLIKRSELKLARGLRSLKNPIAIQRCTSCGQVYGQTTECPMCRAGVGVRRNPKGALLKLYHIYAGKENLGGVEAVSAPEALKKIANHPKVKGKKIIARLAQRYQHRQNPSLDWKAIRRFNFTYAIPGGAWLEDASGNRDWISFAVITKRLGKTWLDRALRKQGQFTGTWVSVDATKNPKRNGITEAAAGLQALEYIGGKVKRGSLGKKPKYNPKVRGSRDALGVFHANPLPAYLRLAAARNKKALALERKAKQLIERSLDLQEQGKQTESDRVWAQAIQLEKRAKAAGRYTQGPIQKLPNPSSVTALSEKFQGEADGAIDRMHAATGAPANLARAGKLVFLKALCAGKAKTFRIPGATVAIAPNEKLWIVGDHAPLFETKAGKSSEGLDVGEITHICYETAKTHIGGGKTYEYVHEFGEDGGKRPHLVIDSEGMPILRGGDYKIRAEGIVD